MIKETKDMIKKLEMESQEKSLFRNVQDGNVTIFSQKKKKKKEKPAVWLNDNDLIPLKVFEVLLGNNFERTKQETQTYV